MHDAGYRMQDTGYRMQDTGCRMQDAGCTKSVVSFWVGVQRWILNSPTTAV